MEEATVRQLWYISDLLKHFRRGGKTTKQLREWFPTKDAAQKAIETLLAADHREAERINKLPVEMRLWAHKELTDEEWDALIKGGKEWQERERAD